MSALGAMRAATAKASINLRGDLAKLSDAGLAERMEAAWQVVDAHQTRKRGSWWFGRGGPVVHWRGPLRHPRIYRFLSILGIATATASGGNGWLDALIPAVFSSKRYERFLRRDATVDEYLSICEIRDIMDEIKRRLAHRRASSS